MKSIADVRQDKRVIVSAEGLDGGVGIVIFRPVSATVIFSWGGGWDHVSVSFPHRCPTWDEMCQIKDIFFKPDECVIQYHPPQKDYINRHPYVLHLWRPQAVKIPMPPKEMV